MVILFAEREVGIHRPWPLHPSDQVDVQSPFGSCHTSAGMPRADGGNGVVYSLHVDIK